MTAELERIVERASRAEAQGLALKSSVSQLDLVRSVHESSAALTANDIVLLRNVVEAAKRHNAELKNGGMQAEKRYAAAVRDVESTERELEQAEAATTAAAKKHEAVRAEKAQLASSLNGGGGMDSTSSGGGFSGMGGGVTVSTSSGPPSDADMRAGTPAPSDDQVAASMMRYAGANTGSGFDSTPAVPAVSTPSSRVAPSPRRLPRGGANDDSDDSSLDGDFGDDFTAGFEDEAFKPTAINRAEELARTQEEREKVEAMARRTLEAAAAQKSTPLAARENASSSDEEGADFADFDNDFEDVPAAGDVPTAGHKATSSGGLSGAAADFEDPFAEISFGKLEDEDEAPATTPAADDAGDEQAGGKPDEFGFAADFGGDDGENWADFGNDADAPATAVEAQGGSATSSPAAVSPEAAKPAADAEENWADFDDFGDDTAQPTPAVAAPIVTPVAQADADDDDWATFD